MYLVMAGSPPWGPRRDTRAWSARPSLDARIQFSSPASPAGTKRVGSPVAGDTSREAEASEDEDEVVLLANAASDDEAAVSYPVDAGVASFPPAQVS